MKRSPAPSWKRNCPLGHYAKPVPRYVQGPAELAFKKRLLPQNPAQSIRPLKRDDARPGEKRLPLTLDQIAAFFSSDFYRSCAPGAEKPYARKDRDWRFWLPLVCLFMGMRPNEVCQMLVAE